MLDPFYLKTDQEIKKMINDFWSDQEYLVKLRVLLKFYPSYNITKLEARNINKIWQSLSLEKKKDIYQNIFRYQIPGQS